MAALAITAFVSLAWLPAPWAWIGVMWFAISWTVSWHSRERSATWFNLGIAFLVLGLFEAAAWLRPEPRFDPERAENYAGPDDVLGYAPKLVGRVPITKYYGDELVYDVVYTFDSNHLRVSSPRPAPPDRNAPCVLLFGGSYSYGEGVDDDATLAWRITARARMRSLNFAFHGYGPHQMLAAIESGRVERAIDCKPTHAIYMAIADHVNRAVGLAYWDQHGPRYTIDSSGLPVRDGHFDDSIGTVEQWLWDQGQKSLIAKRVSQRRREVTDEDMSVFHAIVDGARHRLVERYPQIAFHAILWDRSGEPPAEFWEGLERRGIPVHRMSQILPQRRDGDPRFEVSLYDRHPNASVYDRIAQYVARHIIAGSGV